MFKFNTSTSILVISLLTLTVFVLPVFSVDLPFDPNQYSFLVYNPGGDASSIQQAMHDILGRYLTPSEIRTYTNPVTPEDLATHDILIVGWNANGNINGLHSKDLLAGITGRVILTGHDADLHIVLNVEDAETFLVNAINYVLTGSG
ncbi:MAG: hypothetical protein WCW64_11195, partial [Phycisphaerae bacterium]